MYMCYKLFVAGYNFFHIYSYQWFMRADDDIYIKTEKLEKFLRTLNSSEPIFLGQTGLGNAEVSDSFFLQLLFLLLLGITRYWRVCLIKRIMYYLLLFSVAAPAFLFDKVYLIAFLKENCLHISN